MWTEVNFGKWTGKGKTLPQIVFIDPDWFFWAIESNAFKKFPLLAQQASRLYERTRHIKIPARFGANARVEYAVNPAVGKFTDIEIVPFDRPKHQGSTPTFRGDLIDMSVPRQISGYDKTGGKILTKSLKHILFGSSTKKLTRELCEQFFDDDTNFEMPA